MLAAAEDGHPRRFAVATAERQKASAQHPPFRPAAVQVAVARQLAWQHLLPVGAAVGGVPEPDLPWPAGVLCFQQPDLLGAAHLNVIPAAVGPHPRPRETAVGRPERAAVAARPAELVVPEAHIVQLLPDVALTKPAAGAAGVEDQEPIGRGPWTDVKRVGPALPGTEGLRRRRDGRHQEGPRTRASGLGGRCGRRIAGVIASIALRPLTAPSPRIRPTAAGRSGPRGPGRRRCPWPGSPSASAVRWSCRGRRSE